MLKMPTWYHFTAAVALDRRPALAGDARFDSPGHSARYCTYTFLDAVSDIYNHKVK